MHSLNLLTEVAVTLAAALAGGVVARLLRLPLLLGYLVAGIAVGPHTPGFVANEEAVHSVAHVGVALLMFAVGVQFSLEELRAVQRLAILGGGIQITLTVLLGVAIGMSLGWGLFGGLFLGCAISLSSTAVMMRLLEDRGELGSAHGSAMLGILVVQDLTLVAMVMILPSIAEVTAVGPQALIGVGLTLLRAVLFLTVTLFLAFKGVPLVLDRIARTGSRELFLLSVVCICLGAGYLAHLAGFSLEIGAFLAGIVVTESDYAHEVFAQVRPLRDVFASLFFVSIGMLLDPKFLVSNWAAVTLVVFAIIVGKGLIAGLAIYGLGSHGRTSILAGLGLAQIGEFSFVLAGLGVQRKLIPEEVSSVVLSAALITLLLTPFVFGGAPALYTRLNRHAGLSRWLNRKGSGEPQPHASSYDARAVILGGGRVGAMVSAALREHQVPHTVVEYDSANRARLLAEGVPVVYGDATSEAVVKQAVCPTLELAVITLPDAEMTRMAIHTVRKVAPNIRIVARIHRAQDAALIRRDGADAIIQPEFEAGTAMIQEGLRSLGLSPDETERYIIQIRDAATCAT